MWLTTSQGPFKPHHSRIELILWTLRYLHFSQQIQNNPGKPHMQALILYPHRLPSPELSLWLWISSHAPNLSTSSLPTKHFHSRALPAGPANHPISSTSSPILSPRPRFHQNMAIPKDTTLPEVLLSRGTLASFLYHIQEGRLASSSSLLYNPLAPWSGSSPLFWRELISSCGLNPLPFYLLKNLLLLD